MPGAPAGSSYAVEATALECSHWSTHRRRLSDRGSLALAEAPKTSNGSWWGNENEVLIKFEINRPEAEPGRYRRPYVAVWVEDAQGAEVRSLLIWVSLGGSGPDQWLPDLQAILPRRSDSHRLR